MKIGGFQKLSLIDYPGKISSIIFTTGCNLRCQFCYVPQLVIPEKIKEIKEIPEGYIFSYLEKNKGFIDAVVITGGEPFIHEDLPSFIQKIKTMGFLVGLETNGTNAQMLKDLIDNKLIDYVGIDIKTSLNFEKYNEIVGNVLTQEMFENIKNSINILLNSRIDYDLRTTLVKEFHSEKDILEICKVIKGAKNYYLQKLKLVEEFISRKKFHPFNEEKIEKIIAEGKKFVNIIYRG